MKHNDPPVPLPTHPPQVPHPTQRSFPYQMIPEEYEMEMLKNGRAYSPDTWAQYYQWMVDRGYMDRNPLPFNLQRRIDRHDYPPRNIPPGMDYHIAGKDRVPKSVYQFLNPQPTPPPGMGRPMPVPPGLMPSPMPTPRPKQPSVLPPPSYPPPFSPPPDMGIKPPPPQFPRENPRDQPPQDFPGPPAPPKSPLPQNPGIQPDPSGKITKAPVQKTTKPTLNSYIKRYERI